MCGLVGFTLLGPAEAAREIVEAMLAPIRHRGPDGDGVHVDCGLALGHVRLAVIDLSGGRQPRCDGLDGAALAYNGEIYGYRNLADRLHDDGIVLRDRSDTEVLFQMLKTRGVEATLAEIDGMFAFAYREAATGRLFLARDRFGEKPLFYGLRNGVLVFASEVRAIRKHPLFSDCGFDRDAVARYLTLQYLPGEDSGYEGIKKLPPGHLLEFQNAGIRLKRYWKPQPGCGKRHVQTPAERISHLERLFSESVRQRLVADVPVGVFLSGGLDSSLVAAFAAKHMSAVTAFSVRMDGASFDETPFARTAAEHIGIPHEVVEFRQADLMNAFDSVAEHLDEPMADASLLPTFLVCQAARRQVTVALGGDGADELFAGYPNFIARRLGALMALTPRVAGSALRLAIDALSSAESYMGLGFKLRQLSYGFGHHPDHQTHQWMAAFSAAEQRSLWRSDAIPAETDGGLGRQVTRILSESGCRDGFDRLQYLFIVGYLAEDILTKVDRASMYNSLEVRAPFLARDFAEYALSLPQGDKLNGLETKSLLKKMALRHLPESVVRRRKHGFAPPLASMLRGPLKGRVGDILFDAGNPLASWFRREEIERYWHEHQSGRRDHHRKLWTLGMLMRVAAGSRVGL
jgi:asparagine synthase (glutamine-hydrolysing)